MLFVGLYFFNTTVIASEEDFNTQELTFTLIQKHRLPSNDEQSKTNTEIVNLPSLGEIVDYLLLIAGMVCLLGVIGHILARKLREDDYYEKK